MSEDDNISFDAPHEWQLLKLDTGSPRPAGMRLEIYKFGRGNGESLSGPTLVDLAREGGSAQAKILFADVPFTVIDRPTDQERKALLHTMIAVARVLNEEEMDGGRFDLDQARSRAEALVRDTLPANLKSDTKV